MSYDIGYYTQDTWNKTDGDRIPIEVSPFEDEGGTIRAVLDENGKLIPAHIEECEINITYNYGPFYYKHIDEEKGLRWLYGRTGKECLPVLTHAVSILGIERCVDPLITINADYTIGLIFRPETKIPVSDEKHKEYLKVDDWDNHPDKKELLKLNYLSESSGYWRATPGNAGRPLMRIISWIAQNPNGVFNGD